MQNVKSRIKNDERSDHFVPLCLCASVPFSKSGFSLVEICLALLIVGIGMLSILSMFPAGLDQNTRSIGDTHAALFAEDVFSALHVHAETNWEGIGHSIMSVPVASANNWFDNGLTNVLDNQLHTNIYCHPDNSNVVDHACRYRISLTTNGMIKAATVRYWQGQFGATNNPTLFYSEFFNFKQ